MPVSGWITAMTVIVNCTAGQWRFSGAWFPLSVKCGVSIEKYSFPSSSDICMTVISFRKLFSDCDECFLFVSEQSWPFDLGYDPENSYLAFKNLFIGKIKMVQSWAPKGSTCTHQQHTDTHPIPLHGHTNQWNSCTAFPRLSQLIPPGWEQLPTLTRRYLPEFIWTKQKRTANRKRTFMF